MHSSQSCTITTWLWWSGAEQRSNTIGLPVCHVFVSQQIVAAITGRQSRSKNQFIPLFLDHLGQSEKGCKVILNLLPCFLRSEHGVRAFSISLFSSSLSIGLSLSSPLLFSGDPSTSGSSEIGGYETSSGGLSFQQRQFILPLSLFFLFPSVSLRSLFLPSSIPILFAVSALLFTYFSPSVFCFPIELNIYIGLIVILCFFFTMEWLFIIDDEWV